MSAAAELPAPIRGGTPAFRRTNLAMFAAGWSTFALLYCVQPLMPVFAAEYGVSPAESSLVVSLTTGMLAFAILPAGGISDAWGRKRVILASMAASSVLTLAGAAAQDFHQLLLLRLLLGIALSGVPSIAMA